jgi:hypothetical protein
MGGIGVEARDCAATVPLMASANVPATIAAGAIEARECMPFLRTDGCHRKIMKDQPLIEYTGAVMRARTA